MSLRVVDLVVVAVVILFWSVSAQKRTGMWWPSSPSLAQTPTELQLAPVKGSKQVVFCICRRTGPWLCHQLDSFCRITFHLFVSWKQHSPWTPSCVNNNQLGWLGMSVKPFVSDWCNQYIKLPFKGQKIDDTMKNSKGLKYEETSEYSERFSRTLCAWSVLIHL